MIEVSAVVQQDYTKNLFFDSKMPQVIPNKISIPRDDNNECFKIFKKKLFENGININTHDLVDQSKIDLEIFFHFNFNVKKKKNIKYCVWPEAPEIYPRNASSQIDKDFNKIFTTFDNDVDNKKFFPIKYPINFRNSINPKFNERKKLCCILSSNKTLSVNSSNSGYSERVKIIKWFEKYNPLDLSLYGVGWNGYFSSNYYLNRYFRRLINKIYKKKISVYQGVAISKSEIYQNHKFSICYENVLGKSGYFCELIFDSMNNGCIPVYLGSSNITEYIPQNCFIDRRNFTNNQELLNYLKNFKEGDYNDMQDNINNFLKEQTNQIFSVEFFANQIIKHIKIDLCG